MKGIRYNSLTLRLTVLIASGATLVLLGLGFLIGESVEQHFEEQDIEILSGKIQLVQHALEKTNSTEEIPKLQQLLMDSLVGHHGLALKIVTQGGEVLFSTPDAETPATTLLHLPSTGETLQPIKWIDRKGTPVRGVVMLTDTGIPSAKLVMVSVATDITHHEHFMKDFRVTLWVFIVVAALVMGVIGWLAVHRGLRPLKSIRDEASEITARHLNKRIPLNGVPNELADLVITLNEMLGRLENSFRRLSDFSSDLAHELRTPVSNLLTETQVTMAKLRTVDQYQDVLASNVEELERMAAMISDMLYLAKSDNDLMIPHQESVCLQKEVGSLFDYYEALAEEEHISMRCHGGGDILGDRLMLRRAIGNLLSNALRHTPKGGEILVRINTNASNETRIEVENPGQQIPAEHLPRLFDRFYRVDPSRQRSSEGAGLGLAITKSIIRTHGGTVSVQSNEQRTVFELLLPSKRLT